MNESRVHQREETVSQSSLIKSKGMISIMAETTGIHPVNAAVVTSREVKTRLEVDAWL